GGPDARVADASAAIAALGLSSEASPLRAGLVACTGNTGCKFALADTKGHATAIADWCEPRVKLDQPVNIHLTGCHHSCAQHFISEIGLLAAKVEDGESDAIEGYHIHIGGAFGPEAALGRGIDRDVKPDDAPTTVDRMLAAYVRHRASPSETFLAFANRHDLDALKALVAAEAA